MLLGTAKCGVYIKLMTMLCCKGTMQKLLCTSLKGLQNACNVQVGGIQRSYSTMQ